MRLGGHISPPPLIGVHHPGRAAKPFISQFSSTCEPRGVILFLAPAVILAVWAQLVTEAERRHHKFGLFKSTTTGILNFFKLMKGY